MAPNVLRRVNGARCLRLHELRSADGDLCDRVEWRCSLQQCGWPEVTVGTEFADDTPNRVRNGRTCRVTRVALRAEWPRGDVSCKRETGTLNRVRGAALEIL